MTRFGILMVIETSPMPAEKQVEAMKHIRQGFIEAGASMNMKVECKVVPMPSNYDLEDLRAIFIAGA